GVTPLHWASDAGHTATVKLLLADPKIKVNQRLSDDYNATALISAAHIGQTETVKLLLAHPQINVNLVDKLQGRSALMYAVTPQMGDGVGVVTALLAHPHINVNQRDLDGWDALQLAQK
ncbi:ankyrin repeat-containing domain protein, partial [Coprinopsis sp. MPI-PUGE-AT-0042]